MLYAGFISLSFPGFMLWSSNKLFSRLTDPSLLALVCRVWSYRFSMFICPHVSVDSNRHYQVDNYVRIYFLLRFFISKISYCLLKKKASSCWVFFVLGVYFGVCAINPWSLSVLNEAINPFINPWIRKNLFGPILVYYGLFTSLSQWLNFKLFGITYLVGKIKFKLFFQGPLAEWVTSIYTKHLFGPNPKPTKTHMNPKQVEFFPCRRSFLPWFWRIEVMAIEPSCPCKSSAASFGQQWMFFFRMSFSSYLPILSYTYIYIYMVYS